MGLVIRLACFGPQFNEQWHCTVPDIVYVLTEGTSCSYSTYRVNVDVNLKNVRNRSLE
jgi:hypothetical protein